MRIVFNTSPLILLEKIQKLDLLNQLYHEIIIPEAVFDEIRAKTSMEAEQISKFLKEDKFYLRKASRETLTTLSSNLGYGEREAKDIIFYFAYRRDGGLIRIQWFEDSRI